MRRTAVLLRCSNVALTLRRAEVSASLRHCGVGQAAVGTSRRRGRCDQRPTAPYWRPDPWPAYRSDAPGQSGQARQARSARPARASQNPPQARARAGYRARLRRRCRKSAAACGRRGCWQGFDRGGGGIKLAPGMVRYPERIDACAFKPGDILDSHDALDDERAVPGIAQPCSNPSRARCAAGSRYVPWWADRLARCVYLSSSRIRGMPARAMPSAHDGRMATCASRRGVSLGGCGQPERVWRSRRLATGTSTVRTSVRKPASRARFSISVRMSVSRGDTSETTLAAKMRSDVFGVGWPRSTVCRACLPGGCAGQMAFGVRPDQPGHAHRRDPEGQGKRSPSNVRWSGPG